jgi:hypothetical protein
MNTPKPCPGTLATSDETLVFRPRVVAMHNRLYQTREAALEAKTAPLDLRLCPVSGLVYNAFFDPSLVEYDPTYDSSVPSGASVQYCRSLATFLDETFGIASGLVVEAACGKGEFLHLLCEMYPGIRCLGIDPSCVPEKNTDPRIQLIQDIYRQEQVTEQPTLIMCRQAMDQMDDPLGFIRSVAALCQRYPNCGIFIELRDMTEMVRTGSFWDFCFENHCYFTAQSLEQLLKIAGFRVTASARGLGGQYLWIAGLLDTCATEAPVPELEAVRDMMLTYGRNEAAGIQNIRNTLRALRENGSFIAVWGMSTKGVNYVTNVDLEARLITHCIDINSRRHNTFLPVTGHEVEGADALLKTIGQSLAVIITNPAYVAEIRQTCHDMGLHPDFYDASMNLLPSA